MMKSKPRRPVKRRKSLTVDTVEARAITLIDESGKHRASLSCYTGPGVCALLELLDDEGRPRLTLQVDNKGTPSIALYTASGCVSLSMAVSDRGGGLSVSGEGEHGFIGLGVAGDNSDDPRGSGPRLDVVDPKGQRTWSVFEGTIAHPVPDESPSQSKARPTGTGRKSGRQGR